MLTLFQRLISAVAGPDVETDPDESLWSPSGWSEAATGKGENAQFRAPVEVEAPPTLETAMPGQGTHRSAA
jgi:hypothetical protein